MNKAVIVFLLFLIVSCHTKFKTTNNEYHQNQIKLTSSVFLDEQQQFRSNIFFSPKRILFKLTHTLLPLPVIKVDINNKHIEFHNLLSNSIDTLPTNTISKGIKINYIKKIFFRKKNKKEHYVFRTKNLYLSIGEYKELNNVFMPEKVMFSRRPFSDTINIRLKHDSIVVF